MNPQRRPRRSASEWSELIARQAASGLSQRDFCDTEGLAVSTFTYWKRRWLSRKLAPQSCGF